MNLTVIKSLKMLVLSVAKFETDLNLFDLVFIEKILIYNGQELPYYTYLSNFSGHDHLIVESSEKKPFKGMTPRKSHFKQFLNLV
jgi:hypothetical protein